MVEQNLPSQESHAPEVTAALIDLAQLAQHVGSLTIESLDAVANQMLVRLLALCAAQRGAILLGVDEHVAFEQPLSHYRAFRALALNGIGEEEAHVLLTSFPTVDGDLQPGPDFTCWITYRLSVGEFMVESGQYSH